MAIMQLWVASPQPVMTQTQKCFLRLRISKINKKIDELQCSRITHSPEKIQSANSHNCVFCCTPTATTNKLLQLYKYLVWMNRENSLAVDFLDLVTSNKLMHAWLLPLVLAIPQNCMQWTQQCPDVPLLALDPVMHLTQTTITTANSVAFQAVTKMHHIMSTILQRWCEMLSSIHFIKKCQVY